MVIAIDHAAVVQISRGFLLDGEEWSS